MQFEIESNQIDAVDNAGNLLARIIFPETEPDTCTIKHTFVDDSLRGQGMAGELVKMAVGQIIRQGKNVSASCSYAKHWLEKHSAPKVTVLQIFDEDYGCEGVPEGEEPLCRVLLQDADGNEAWLKIPDIYLTRNNIQENSRIAEYFFLLK